MTQQSSTTPVIKVIYDNYTLIPSIDLVYYSYPYNFNSNPDKYDDNNMGTDAVHSFCPLPSECRTDIVNAAVLLFLLANGEKVSKDQPQLEKAEQ